MPNPMEPKPSAAAQHKARKLRLALSRAVGRQFSRGLQGWLIRIGA